MNSFINMNKALMTLAVLAVSFVLLVGPTSMTMNVFATINTANQGIGQSQSSNQNALCVSGTGTLVSCNNLNAQNQANSGNNAAAQQGGTGKGGNKANQAIGQSQSSNQNVACLSGTGTIISCNNLNAQNQQNTGNNALAQQGGSGSGKGKSEDNTANQAIGQSQSSNQNALCVSGTGTLVSCNNLNAQNQQNTGNNALAQQGGSGSGKG